MKGIKLVLPPKDKTVVVDDTFQTGDLDTYIALSEGRAHLLDNIKFNTNKPLAGFVFRNVTNPHDYLSDDHFRTREGTIKDALEDGAVVLKFDNLYDAFEYIHDYFK